MLNSRLPISYCFFSLKIFLLFNSATLSTIPLAGQSGNCNDECTEKVWLVLEKKAVKQRFLGKLDKIEKREISGDEASDFLKGLWDRLESYEQAKPNIFDEVYAGENCFNFYSTYIRVYLQKDNYPDLADHIYNYSGYFGSEEQTLGNRLCSAAKFALQIDSTLRKDCNNFNRPERIIRILKSAQVGLCSFDSGIDLAIEGNCVVDYRYPNRTVAAKVQIQNKADTDMEKAFKLAWKPSDNDGYVYKTISPLKAFQITSIDLPGHTYEEYGKYNFTIVVDRDEEIMESNEENNTCIYVVDLSERNCPGGQITLTGDHSDGNKPELEVKVEDGGSQGCVNYVYEFAPRDIHNGSSNWLNQAFLGKSLPSFMAANNLKISEADIKLLGMADRLSIDLSRPIDCPPNLIKYGIPAKITRNKDLALARAFYVRDLMTDAFSDLREGSFDISTAVCSEVNKSCRGVKVNICWGDLCWDTLADWGDGLEQEVQRNLESTAVAITDEENRSEGGAEKKQVSQEPEPTIGSVIFDEPIQYPKGDSEVPEEIYDDLRATAEFMKQNLQYRYQITGHTNYGSTDFDLSRRRAVKIKEKLVEFGVPQGLLIPEGRANSVPKMRELSAAADAVNQRVEIKIVSENYPNKE
ncbi:MAG: OmpA family protein [Bacteroidota bacterium]